MTPEQEARRTRLRWLLLIVPFTFPIWSRLRREDPGLAATLYLELAVCVFNSALVVLLSGCMCATMAFRPQIIDVLTRLVLDLGLVS